MSTVTVGVLSPPGPAPGAEGTYLVPRQVQYDVFVRDDVGELTATGGRLGGRLVAGG